MTSYRILHILTTSPYSKQFIEFINDNFNANEHLFIVLCMSDKDPYIDFYRLQNNCLVTKNKFFFVKYKSQFEKSEQIILHQLNQPILMLSLILFYPQSFKKIVWSVWGADIYPLNKNSLKSYFIEKIREKVISKIQLITAYIRGDYNIVLSNYVTKAKYIKSKYPSPISASKIKKLLEKSNDKRNKTINILISNSAAYENNHLETLQILSKYRDYDIKIIAVLSYGGDNDYVNKVIKYGEFIFNDKFEAILNFMHFDDYLNFINRIDVCVFNYNIQAGLGNLYLLLAMKKKVFIDGKTTPFQYYKEVGIQVYDTNKIVDNSFEDFISFSIEIMNKNSNLIFNDIDEKNISIEWKNVFNEIKEKTL